MTEQELIDFAIDQAVPALQDLSEIKDNTTEMLELYKAQLAAQELELQEELQPEMQALSLDPEEEPVIIDYDPLVLEQLEILNAHMEEQTTLLDTGNTIGAETAWLMVLTVVCAIGVKVLVDQITRW